MSKKMPASSTTHHPHFPRFMSGLAIAIVIVIMGMLAYNYLIQVGEIPEQVEPLATALRTAARNRDYNSTGRLVEKLHYVAMAHLEKGEIEKAGAGFRQIREVLDQIRREAAEVPADKNTIYSFRNQFGKASYRYAECLILAMEKKYPAKNDGQRRQLPYAEITLAGKVIEEGIRSFPSDKRLHRLHGVLKRMTGSLASAVTALEKAIELDNNFAEAYNDLGLVYVNLNDQRKALVNFKSARLASKDRPESSAHKTALFNLGIYYANVDHGGNTAGDSAANRKKAIKHLQDFLSLESSDTSSAEAARKALAKLNTR